MHVLSLIHLKGGVGKTISTINIAYILASEYGKRVLIIDNDKQGNASKFFGRYGETQKGTAELLTEEGLNPFDIIHKTDFENLEIITGNMNLITAERAILIDSSKPQQYRMKNTIEQLEASGRYDFIIIDNPPDLGLCVLNALAASDDVMIPIKIGRFEFEGIQMLSEQIENLKSFNPKLTIAGGFATMHQKNNVNRQGVEVLKDGVGIPMFETVIRKTVKVDETTFAGKPLQVYSKQCTAAKDYMELVKEYLDKMCQNLTQKGGMENGKV